MKNLLIILLSFLSISAYCQTYPYQDIGNSRLLDINGKLYIQSKPGKGLGSFNVIKPMVLDSSLVVKGSAEFLNKITGDINITGSFKVNDIAIGTGGTDTSFIREYDSTRFALRIWTINGRLFNSSITLTKSDLGIDTTNYYNVSNMNTGTLKAGRISDSVLKISTLDTSKIVSTDQAESVTGSKTFVANQSFDGYVKLGLDALYVKVKIIKCAVVNNSWIYTAHGLNWKNIIFISGVIRHDTTSSFYYDKQVFNLGYNATTIYSTGLICKADSLNVGYYISSASSGITGDTAIITIFHTNMY